MSSSIRSGFRQAQRRRQRDDLDGHINSIPVPVHVTVTNSPLLVPSAESISFNYSLGGSRSTRTDHLAHFHHRST